MEHNGQPIPNQVRNTVPNRAASTDFVLEKSIFTNIFEKDIRRVYIYKKVERLAKAIHLVSPAFRNSPALRDRMDRVAIGLVDAAILPPASARDALSRELLALSSVLSIARVGGLLSSMNADLIAREAHTLLQEIATYEEPRLFFDAAPTLAELAREAGTAVLLNDQQKPIQQVVQKPDQQGAKQQAKELIKDSLKPRVSDSSRKEAIQAILQKNGTSYIKDISTVIRDVSEKTIQRELQQMVEQGSVVRSGDRRWTTYQLA